MENPVTARFCLLGALTIRRRANVTWARTAERCLRGRAHMPKIRRWLIAIACIALVSIALSWRASSIALSAHTLTGYWQNFDNGAANLRLRDVPEAYDIIAVAFADADPA